MTGKMGSKAVARLLQDERIRSLQIGDNLWYVATDVVAVMTDDLFAEAEWDEIKTAEVLLRNHHHCQQAEVEGQPRDLLDLAGVMLLILAIDSAKANRVRNWMVEVAAANLEEQDDPELAIQRLRQSYTAEGRTRRWIDQRLRSISARQEIVGEWYRRGVTESEQFRTLTNKLMESAFGMTVTSLRESKGQARNLRDHLTDLELSLLSLAESTAAMLHRQRDSQGVPQLQRDIEDAGQIVSDTRSRIGQMQSSEPRAAA